MQIGIIGAGPRGLIILERLIAWYRKQATTLQIDLFDFNGIGGKVWQTEQAYELIMNTTCNMITLFEDDSVQNLQGPLTTGPSLYDWAKTEAPAYIGKNRQRFEHTDVFLQEVANLKPDDYTTRALYGVYLNWYYERLIAQLPANIKVQFYPHT